MNKKLFTDINLSPEDIFVLETFQIQYLPDRIPKKEFSALLHANPAIQRFLISKNPAIEEFIKTVLEEFKPVKDATIVNEYCQELLWEIADLIIYNKHPEKYDSKVEFNWTIEEIILPKFLEGKVVIDSGAGTGKLAFKVAQFAKNVFAIEPVSGFRQFIREKARNENVTNLYVLDGFLDSIALPDNSADILMTSNAIGWNLEGELEEIERVVKPNGQVIHLLRAMNNDVDNPFDNILTSRDWKYVRTKFKNETGMKLKYYKAIKNENI